MEPSYVSFVSFYLCFLLFFDDFPFLPPFPRQSPPTPGKNAFFFDLKMPKSGDLRLIFTHCESEFFCRPALRLPFPVLPLSCLTPFSAASFPHQGGLSTEQSKSVFFRLSLFSGISVPTPISHLPPHPPQMGDNFPLGFCFQIDFFSPNISVPSFLSPFFFPLNPLFFPSFPAIDL